MTTSPDPADEPTDDGDFPPAPELDPILAAFVDLINRLGDTEVGVTLHASGSIVSGMLVSARRYFDLLAEHIRHSADEDPDRMPAAEALANYFQPWADDFREIEQADDPSGYLPPAHIHLRAATVHAPGPDEPLPPMYWRGRLTEISGWSIGNYGPIEPPPDF